MFTKAEMAGLAILATSNGGPKYILSGKDTAGRAVEYGVVADFIVFLDGFYLAAFIK